MKKLTGIIFALLFVVFAYTMLDLYLIRGHFLSDFLDWETMPAKSDTWLNMTYEVIPGPDRTYQFKLTNHSLIPKFILVYRNEELFYSLTDSIPIEYALRTKLSYRNWQRDQGAGFDCGTGLGFVSINPFESFEMQKDYFSLTQYYSLYSDLTFHRGVLHYDPIYGALLFSRGPAYDIKWNEASPLTYSDSLEVKFFLPVYDLFKGRHYKLYSNPIKLAYLDLIESYKKSRSAR